MFGGVDPEARQGSLIRFISRMTRFSIYARRINPNPASIFELRSNSLPLCLIHYMVAEFNGHEEKL